MRGDAPFDLISGHDPDPHIRELNNHLKRPLTLIAGESLGIGDARRKGGPLEHHRRGLTSKKHQLLHRLRRKLRPRSHRVDGQEPGPGSVTSHGDPASASGSARE